MLCKYTCNYFYHSLQIIVIHFKNIITGKVGSISWHDGVDVYTGQTFGSYSQRSISPSRDWIAGKDGINNYIYKETCSS